MNTDDFNLFAYYEGRYAQHARDLRDRAMGALNDDAKDQMLGLAKVMQERSKIHHNLKVLERKMLQREEKGHWG